MLKLFTTSHATKGEMVKRIVQTAKDRVLDWDANVHMREENTDVVEEDRLTTVARFDLQDGAFAIVRSSFAAEDGTFIEATVEATPEATFEALKGMLLDYCRLAGKEMPEIIEDETDTRFYVSTTAYIGSFPDEHLDDDMVVISTEPCRTNQDREVRIEGWCGSTGDVSVTAFGEYETLEAAEAYAESRLLGGQFRVVDLDDGEVIDPNVVAAYRYGSEPAWNGQASVDFMNGFHDVDLEPNATDEEIEAMVADWVEDARTHGGIRLNHKAIVKAAIEHRDDLKAKASEEEAEAV